MIAFESPRSVYFHIPFCRHRCGYCDFTLVAGREDLIDRFLLCLARELDVLPDTPEVDTIFLGGGTPTHLSAPDLERLLRLIRKHFALSTTGEFSVEANPLDLADQDRLDVLESAGVNRISLGVQSFDDDVLKTLERDHSVRELAEILPRVRDRFDNLSIDLIFGVPGQSLESWRATLDAAHSYRPRHISTYGLTIEKGTSFWSRRERGTLAATPELLEAAMYELAIDVLSSRGFKHYEISNFAQAGFECRHNLTYWNAAPCYAFGPGAARYLNGVREIGHRSTVTWLKRIESGVSPIGYREELSPIERAHEALIVGMRRIAGIDQRDFERDHGMKPTDLAREAWPRLINRGLVEQTTHGYRLTRAGLLLADTVTVELM